MGRFFFQTAALMTLGCAFSSEIKRIDHNLAITTGYRWDSVSSRGSLTDVGVKNGGNILLEPVSSSDFMRELDNINIWEMGIEMSTVFNNLIFLGAEAHYGFIFTKAREVFSGTLAADDDSFSQAFNSSVVKMPERHHASDGLLRLGVRLTLKGPVYLTPYGGFGFESLSLGKDNSIKTYMPLFGAQFKLHLNSRFDLMGFCHYNYRGRRSEKIQMQTHNSVLLYLPAHLTRGRMSGPKLGVCFGWNFARRWTLDAGYTFRQYRSRNATNGGFGGTTGLKTTWRTQNLTTSIHFYF